MATIHHTKVLIIGSGPAGYTAAIYAARANLQPIMTTGFEPGGQLMVTTDVENYPGFRQVIQGPWLMEEMKAQAEHVGTKLIYDAIKKVNFYQQPFICEGENGDTYIAETVIISTGAQARWLGLSSEDHFRGFGVSGCATCDGFFFRDKEVAVIGGGNSAVEEALYLTHHASKITLIHRRDHLRAESVLQERLFKHPKIQIIWNHVVDEIMGEENPRKVTKLQLKSAIDNQITTLNVDGVFIAIGHTPKTEIFKDQIDMDAEGYIVTTPGTTTTNIPGVFAAGDVQDKVYRQAVTAAGQGCMAALDAEKFMSEASDT
jgi:thioredoxin reductase (NADPH)